MLFDRRLKYPEYVRRALAEGPFNKFRHPGKHVFTWSLR